MDGVANATLATLTGGGLKTAGQEVTVTAPAVGGYSFKGWYAADAGSESGYTGEALSTALSYTLTVNADTDLVAVYVSNTKVKLYVHGTDYKLNGQGPKKGTTQVSLRSGTEVTLEYVGSDTFLHWINSADKIVGTDKKYTFTLMGKTDITAVTVSSMKEEGRSMAFVEFTSEYNWIIAADTWYSDDDPDWYELPKDPMKIGAKFVDWSLDPASGVASSVADILAAIDGETPHLVIKGIYENVNIPVTLTIKNNVDDEVVTLTGNRGKQQVLNAVDKTSAGYTFSHWSLDAAGEEAIGSMSNYPMTQSHDLTVYMQYVKTGESTIARKHYVEIMGMYGDKVDDTVYITTIAVRDVPSSAGALMEKGILVAYDNDVAEATAEEEMVLENAKMSRQVTTSTSRHTSLLLRTKMESEDSVLWARGYYILQLETGETMTFYSKVHSASYADLVENGYVPYVEDVQEEDNGSTGEDETPVVPME